MIFNPEVVRYMNRSIPKSVTHPLDSKPSSVPATKFVNMHEKLQNSFVALVTNFKNINANTSLTDQTRLVAYNTLQPDIQGLLTILKDRAHSTMMSLLNPSTEIDLKLV